jgi:hypothetical protein
MGSFRSSPDTEKHTVVKEGANLSYAVSHMCGRIFKLFKVGEIIWRTHTLPCLPYQIINARFSLFLMAMEVSNKF